MRASGVRAAAVAVVAAVVLVVPAVSATAAGRTPDRPPVLSQVGTSNPESACVIGAARPLVRSAPTLRTVVTDPEGQNVSARFVVLDARGRVVWAPPTTAAQASGATQAVQVPEGKLLDGATYTWLVSGRDAAGHWALPRFCQLSVDATAPTLPVVTPVAGEPAVYVEDATSGGTGLRGSFTFSDPSTDVVSYTYAFTGGPTGTTPATAPTVAFTPTAAGPLALTVQAVDKAGNVSADRLYRFTVAPAVVTGGGGRWLLDEGAGPVAAESTGGAPLDLTAGTTWTAGALAELAAKPADRALLLDSPTDGARTAGPVLSTTGSYTVSVFARLDAVGTAGTVVSQDGTATSALTLGYTTDGCAAGVAACWSFAVATQDAAAASRVVVRSAAAVTPGSWVQLTGVHDATTGVVTLFVCNLGSAASPGNLAPVASGPAPFTSPWAASGAFRVGQAFGGAAPFVGAVSSVTVLEGVAQTISSVRRTCSAGA